MHRREKSCYYAEISISCQLNQKHIQKWKVKDIFGMNDWHYDILNIPWDNFHNNYYWKNMNIDMDSNMHCQFVQASICVKLFGTVIMLLHCHKRMEYIYMGIMMNSYQDQWVWVGDSEVEGGGQAPLSYWRNSECIHVGGRPGGKCRVPCVLCINIS